MQIFGTAPPPFVTWAESLSTQTDRIRVKTRFFLSSCIFGPKTGLILSEYLFFFWSSHTDSEWRKNFFGLHYFQISCPPPPPPPFRKSCVRYCSSYRRNRDAQIVIESRKSKNSRRTNLGFAFLKMLLYWHIGYCYILFTA